LEVSTFGVEQFSVPSVLCGRSARAWRMVRRYSVRRVFFVFLLAFVFDPLWFRVLFGRGFGRSTCAGRTVRGCMADSPRAPRGRSVIRGRYWRFYKLLRTVRSPGRTVRRTRADNPRYAAGRSAWPLRTVRTSWPDGPPELGCFISWFDSSPLLSCFRVCFKESFLRLEVDL
jgi:hypothetical protein